MTHKPQEKKLNVRKLRILADMFHEMWDKKAETSDHAKIIHEHLVGVRPFVDFVKQNWRKL